jgi:hypothetical protein
MNRFVAGRWTSTCFLIGTLLAASLAANAAGRADELLRLKSQHFEAWTGEPFGVGKIRLELGENDHVSIWPGQMLWFEDAQHRTHYPVLLVGKSVIPVISKVEGGELSAYFLFQGTQPLDVSLHAQQRRHTTRLLPKSNNDRHRELLDDWWQHYSTSMTNQVRTENYPPHVENYLVAMLARRLHRESPRVNRGWSGSEFADEIFGTLIGAESVRLAMQKDTLLKTPDTMEMATLPLPEGVGPPAVTIPEFPDTVAIEALAQHVPAECFYIRCRGLDDFRWLRAVTEKLGADVRHLVSARALDYEIAPRLQRQLALRETVLARWFGDAVIADVAVIGTDTFFREGAAIGVMFQARDTRQLGVHLRKMRADVVAADATASEHTMQIAGHDVSLLSSPGNAVRSFYAVSGDVHLVTTSQTIVRRFFEAGQGRDALAQLQEFRYARHLMPLSRDDAIFVYLSDPFFRLLVGPAYRVEMTRRMQADSDLQLIELAKLAARGEGHAAQTLDELSAGGFLPPNFGQRPDGSRPLLTDPVSLDSLRGARGSFLPVPDVAIGGITRAEHDAYQNFAQIYQRQWTRMDPVIVAIQRQPGDVLSGRENVTIDVHITPYAQQHYGMLQVFLGPPDEFRITNVEGSLLQAQAVLKSQEVGDRSRNGRIFAGLRDFSPAFRIENGTVVPEDRTAEEVAAYAGETSRQILGTFISSDNQPAGEGYSELPGQSYFPKWVHVGSNKIATCALRKSVLEQVVPYLEVEPAERAAQIRLHIGELTTSDAGHSLHVGAYFRARQASAGNSLLLHSLMQQMHVPPESSLQAAQRMLAGNPVCPLGGTYELAFVSGAPQWQSTAWQSPQLVDEKQAPADYRFALIEWIRRAELEFSIDATTITTHTELQLVRPAAE